MIKLSDLSPVYLNYNFECLSQQYTKFYFNFNYQVFVHRLAIFQNLTFDTDRLDYYLQKYSM